VINLDTTKEGKRGYRRFEEEIYRRVKEKVRKERGR